MDTCTERRLRCITNDGFGRVCHSIRFGRRRAGKTRQCSSEEKRNTVTKPQRTTLIADGALVCAGACHHLKQVPKHGVSCRATTGKELEKDMLRRGQQSSRMITIAAGFGSASYGLHQLPYDSRRRVWSMRRRKFVKRKVVGECENGQAMHTVGQVSFPHIQNSEKIPVGIAFRYMSVPCRNSV